MKLSFNVGLVCDVGVVRTNNEDNFYMPEFGIKDKNQNIYKLSDIPGGNKKSINERTFYAVCDGMGGLSAGEEAAYRAVLGIKNAASTINTAKKFEDAIKLHDDIICGISESIFDASCTNPDFKNMGCTLCGLYFFDGKAISANVGDSRVYMIKKKKLVQLSVDHTDITVRKGALTKYLGMDPEYGVLTTEFSVDAIPVNKKERFMLCSDGLTDMVSDEEIENILLSMNDPQEAAEELTKIAKNYGGVDNITCMIIDAEPAGNIFVKLSRRKSSYVALVCALLIASGAVFGYRAYKSNNIMDTIELSEGLSLEDMEALSANNADWKDWKQNQTNAHNTFMDNKKSAESMEANIASGGYSLIDGSAELNKLKENIAEYNEAYKAYDELYQQLDSMENDAEKKEALAKAAETVWYTYQNIEEDKKAADDLKIKTKQENEAKAAAAAAEAKAKAEAEARAAEANKSKETKKTQSPKKNTNPNPATQKPVTPAPATPKPATSKPATPGPAFGTHNRGNQNTGSGGSNG